MTSEKRQYLFKHRTNWHDMRPNCISHMKFAIFSPPILELSQVYRHCSSTVLRSLAVGLVIGICSVLEAVKFNPTFFLTLNPVGCTHYS
jgi:hypothetical protein